MRQFSSGLKNNDLIEAFRQVPDNLRSAVSKLVTDQIFWREAGSQKIYALPDEIKVYYEHAQDEHHVRFKKGDILLHSTKIKKWPANWHDEQPDRDKLKM